MVKTHVHGKKVEFNHQKYIGKMVKPLESAQLMAQAVTTDPRGPPSYKVRHFTIVISTYIYRNRLLTQLLLAVNPSFVHQLVGSVVDYYPF